MQQNPDMAALLQLIQTPEARELLSALRRSGGKELRDALSKASSGDYADAQKCVGSLMEDPKLRSLLQQLGGMP